MFTPLGRKAATLVGLIALGATPLAQASDAVKNSPAKSSISHDAPAEPSALGKLDKKSAAKAAPTEDPLDRLRERLAERLGAIRPADANLNLMRVVSRSGAVASTAATAVLPGGVHIEPALPMVESRRSITALRSAPAKTRAAGDQWAYDGDGGPDNWAHLKPEFAACSNGKRQSPIDIRDGISVQLDPVQFDYKPSSFRVIDTGHTVQVNVGTGNSIEVQDKRFELLQFHFHRPSEERINGRQFDMVAHLVHKDLEGRLAVVAVLLDRGSVQPIVQSVWNNLPLEKGDEVVARGSIDLSALLPVDRRYFTYMGSLTTPPCSEGVLWMVMQNPVSMSPEQISIFSRLYPMNARPIQSAGGRLIKGSN